MKALALDITYKSHFTNR